MCPTFRSSPSKCTSPVHVSVPPSTARRKCPRWQTCICLTPPSGPPHTLPRICPLYLYLSVIQSSQWLLPSRHLTGGFAQVLALALAQPGNPVPLIPGKPIVLISQVRMRLQSIPIGPHFAQSMAFLGLPPFPTCLHSATSSPHSHHIHHIHLT